MSLIKIKLNTDFYKEIIYVKNIYDLQSLYIVNSELKELPENAEFFVKISNKPKHVVFAVQKNLIYVIYSRTIVSGFELDRFISKDDNIYKNKIADLLLRLEII
jgi:hypothetical protein